MIVPAILIVSRGATPKPVKLDIDSSALFLDRPDQALEELPLRSLVRRGDERGMLRLGRRGHPGWELRVSGTAAREVMAVMPGPATRLRRVLEQGWAMWPVAAALVALAVAQIPADWAAGLTPSPLKHRLLPSDLYDPADRCSSAAGEQAIRRLIARFDGKLAESVSIEVVRSQSFVLTSLPDDRLLISEAVLRDAQPDALAALLAHEIAHLRNDDAVEAVFRARGPVETYSRMLFGPEGDPQGSLLRFSRSQEDEADQAALAMMIAARISTRAAADYFFSLDSSDGLGNRFGPAQAALHPGPSWRAVDWALAAKTNPNHGHAFSPAEAEAVASFCPAQDGKE